LGNFLLRKIIICQYSAGVQTKKEKKEPERCRILTRRRALIDAIEEDSH
jgi:hypothetical protein